MTISLNKFYNNNKGKTLANPNPDATQPRQCVSLAQQYLYQCLDIPFHLRDHAKE